MGIKHCYNFSVESDSTASKAAQVYTAKNAFLGFDTVVYK